ncbi:MAG: TetR/AcrR family transcriptional regulator [Actinomycetia bacterium]|nr:TetR/AcrR family transcriptional regulator [Actinomycetes bacterium]
MPAAERRQQLLDVAILVFSDVGYHGASMNDIALAAGITKPVIYQHFDSKLDLYLQLLEDIATNLSDTIGRAVSDAERGRGQFEAGLLAYFKFVEEHRSEFRVLFGSRAQATGEFGSALRTAERSITTSVAELVEVSDSNPRTQRTATAIVSMAEGTCRHWLAHELDISVEELASELADLLWNGMKPTS